MPAKPRADHSNRTFLVHTPTYDAILEYYSRSPEGIKGAQVIRKILYEYGLFCAERLNSGAVGSMDDLETISDFVKDFMPGKANHG